MLNGDHFKITLDNDTLKKLGGDKLTLDVETEQKLGDNLRFRFIRKYLLKIIDNYMELIREIYDYNFVEQELEPTKYPEYAEQLAEMMFKMIDDAETLKKQNKDDENARKD